MVFSNSNHHHLLLLPILTTVFTSVLSSNVFIKSTIIYPFSCSNPIWMCNSYLYHISKGHSLEQIASLYAVNVSSIKPISRGFKDDYLVSVPCSCKDVNDTRGYFYDTFYKVKSGDTFFSVSDEFYSGQAWKVAGEEKQFVAGNTTTIHLICGCLEVESQEVVTYTVQEDDTLSEIAALLSATVNEIENLNERLTQNPSFIDVGWVIFVPKGREGFKAPRQGYSPLSWTARALIALDAARGIEYIHDHTKARYVHRDIKTSNILLDQGHRAKVADFGLARLVERSNEEDIIATRLVGTPGYIAPESVRELQMTSKTDVYAFGVVLAELVTGQRALIRDNETNKVKSLASIIFAIFNEQELETALQASTDPNLKGSYPMEEVYKMAELSRWCLSEEAEKRPEMREIVQILSQIVMSSIEWEATFGGTSEVFTGLISGR